MIRKVTRVRLLGFAAVLLTLSTPGPVAAQAKRTTIKTPKPDLHAGGVDPSSIPNDETTEVTLPGYNLAGAHVETDHLCKVESLEVGVDTAPNKLKMKILGTRTVADEDGRCTLTVRTPGGTASTWVSVELTDAQQEEQTKRQRADERAKAQAFVDRAGKVWHFHYADGTTEVFRTTGPNEDGMPTFQNAAGTTVRIAVTNDDTVTLIGDGCIRSGKLVGSQVKDGESRGECKPAGSWTATVER